MATSPPDKCAIDNNSSGAGGNSRRGTLPISSGFPSPLPAKNVGEETAACYRGGAVIATSAATRSDTSVDGEQKLLSTYAERFIRLIHLMNPRHTLTTESDVRRYQRLLKDHDAVRMNPCAVGGGVVVAVVMGAAVDDVCLTLVVELTIS